MIPEIFVDESVAHNCVGNTPENRIMRDFYHAHLQEHGPEDLPHILGLTASPVTSNVTGMKYVVLIPCSFL